MEQKIKQDTTGVIGVNIRRIRKRKGIGQVELVRMMNLRGIPITRECLVKIERGVQHVQLQQLRAIRDVLDTTYEKLLD
ncbi:MAG: helix-turn-helix transcriptional regulator [Lachnospiraceae bacterium]|nr:helix-turn-helix transcriptional regulator [Lachnospiraceae bacterium]